MKDKDVICCFGDSMTASGFWVAKLYENIVKKGVMVYNCGVSGDTAHDAIRRIYSDCLCHNPSIVTVMFGINDIEPSSEKKSEEQQLFIKNRHKDALEKIVNILRESGAKVVLCDPPSYMEGDGYDAVDYKCNYELDLCRENIYELAEKYGCDVIDIHTAILNALKTKKVMCGDRVHPNMEGYNVIANAVMDYFGLSYTDDFDGEFKFSAINRERREADAFCRQLMYAEHRIIGQYCADNNVSLSEEERKELCLKYISDDSDYIANAAKAYLNNMNMLIPVKNRVKEKTIEMFKKETYDTI